MSRPLRAALAELGAAPCPDAPGFVCGHIDVPVDPDAAPGAELAGETLPIGFAARPASDPPSLGLLVELTGGPGYSGLDEADDWSWIDPALSERFDMVFFDLRGVGASGGFDCPNAAAAWYGRSLAARTPGERAAVADRAARFARDCPAEIGAPAALQAAHDTARAAGDLEALRLALGGAPVTLSGVSYGTQLAQAYVSRYPAHVRAVVLDGVVDVTRRGLDFALDLTAAAEDVLVRTLAACDGEPACAAGFTQAGAPSALAAYDALAARLAAAPWAFDFPLWDGTSRPRTLDAADLEALLLPALDDETLRASLLRALAAAAQGRPVPLRRLADTVSGIDESTDVIAPAPFADTGFSDAVYYTITCHDYGRAAEGPEGWLAACDEAAGRARATPPCFGDLPCATWPTAAPEGPRPDTFAPAGVPVLVINADADVATPVVQGRAVAAGLRAAGAAVQTIDVLGGHHVMWGSDPCVDAAVSAFVFAPEAPRADVTCDVGLVAPVAPLSPAEPEAYAEPWAFASALTAELWALPDFPGPWAWGCDGGGAVEVDDDFALTFDACVFFAGLRIDGVGAYDPDAETLRWQARVHGPHTGTLTYTEDPEAEGAATLTGTWDGQAVGP